MRQVFGMHACSAGIGLYDGGGTGVDKCRRRQRVCGRAAVEACRTTSGVASNGANEKPRATYV